MKKKKEKDYCSAAMIKNAFGFIIVFLIIVLQSCKEEIIVIPPDIIPMDSMASLIVDFKLLEAMKIKKSEKDSVSEDSLLIQYALILKKHNLTKEQFEQSFDFYKSYPELLEDIYEMAINELSRRQAALGPLFKAKADSVKQSKGHPPDLQKRTKRPVVKTTKNGVKPLEKGQKK